MKRVAFATLGCKVNQFETADMIEQFQRAGWETVPFNSEAELYVINTCTVTGRSDSESRRLIRRTRRRSPLAKIVATGCYAQVRPDELAALPELDQILGNEEKTEIVTCVLKGHNRVTDLTTLKQAGPLRLTSHTEHTRAFLQIQTGCEQSCSYCIVPSARGPNRSVPADEVREAVRRLAASEFKEVVVTGIHLGAYGADLAPASSLTALAQTLDNDAAIPRLRLGSIEPNELTDELLRLIVQSDRICHHLHLPLQSGSDTVLKRMGRSYTADHYRQVVERAAYQLPDAFIAADVICGFPGETDAEFEETSALISSLPLADLHVFPFSRRPGAPAATLPGQMPAAVITQRAAQLRKIAAEKLAAFQRQQIGHSLKALGIRRHPEGNELTGLSRNYLEIRYPGSAGFLNQELEVIITGIDNGMLQGVEKNSMNG